MDSINVGYGSTNYYVLAAGATRLLIDVGWPGTLPKLAANLKRKGLQVADITYLLVTHYHPDHAGMAQELANTGTRLIVLETQPAAIASLKTLIKPEQKYVDIRIQDAVPLTFTASRIFLKQIGIDGEIIATPGHSDDSVTLVLDQGIAFTGDLTPPLWGSDEAPAGDPLAQSWQALRARNVHTVYPGHGPARPLH